MEQATDEKQAAITLHLLHGTWASHAAWTQPDSELVKSLQKEFGKPLPMEWKGKNRDSDRRSAAEQVIAALQQQEGRHVLIAHSHGGNVALYAAADHRLHGKIAGIICLNTPFISIIRRDYTTRLALLAMLAVVAPIMWAAGDLIKRVEGVLMEGFVTLGAGILIALTLGSVIPLLRYFQRKGTVIWNRLAPTHVHDIPVLCISAGDDEAQYSLSLLEHVANLPTILQHPFMMMVLFFGCVGMQIAGLLPEFTLFGFSSGLVYGGFMYVLAFFLVLQLIAIVFSFVAGRIALGLGFGYWPLLYNFFVRVSVTPTPLYYRLVDFIDFVIPAGKKLSMLAHSRVYQDERAIQQVVLWIKNGFALSPNAKEINEINVLPN
jgi:pimeloyl-ACP methyl ester carboxylesterase